MTPEETLQLAYAALLIPLLAAALLTVVPSLRHQGMPAALISVGAAAVSLCAASVLFVHFFMGTAEAATEVVLWIPRAGFTLAEVGVHVDGVSVSMTLIVTFVAFCVQVFSLGYMAEEPPADFGRYFTYHSLFIFSMLTLVLAPNMLQFFMGWELVGLASYLLIGFYYKKPSAARAAVKAFWVTKFADMGLLLGVILLYSATNGFAFDVEMPAEMANIITLLLFIGVMGKSAQFPLHIWLPDAMEGPTPVSALLHAATMVAAGVYLLVRAEPLFAQAEDTRLFMAYIGGFTAFFAACIAVVQTDIKKVLAYSTCSQLGYMVCAMGAGSLMGGYFHLTTHAFFKALLFLSAGAVIHAVHSNELEDMGGLFKKLPLTGTVFILGSLALAGVPGLAGFFSKDLILEALFESQLWVPFALLMGAAFLTAFYMGRVIFMAFFGEPSDKAKGAHGPGFSMKLPLVLLAVPTVLAGYFAGDFAELYGPAVEYHFHLGPVGIGASALALSGLGLSYLVYHKKSVPLSSFAFLAPVGKMARSGALDAFYVFAYERVALRLAGAIGWFDRYVIDGLMNFSGWATMVAGERLRKVQTGNVRDYVYVVIVALLMLSAWSIQ